MNTNHKKRIKQLARGKKCPKCLTVGAWRDMEEIKGINLTPIPGPTAGRRDFDNPVSQVCMTCISCGCDLDLQPRTGRFLPDSNGWVSWRINQERLVFQILIVAVLTGGVAVLVGSKYE